MAKHPTSLLLAGILSVLLACVMGAAWANDAAPAADNPALEARMLTIASELRCLVCQNQTIADSHAELAVDLRRQVREMLQAGKTDQEITDYMTAVQGDHGAVMAGSSGYGGDRFGLAVYRAAPTQPHGGRPV